MNDVNIQTSLPDNEELVITTKQKRKEVVPAYCCFGDNNEFFTRESGYDELFRVFAFMDNAGVWLFWLLQESINRKTNEAVFKVSTTKDKQLLSRGYKELYNLNIVMRIRKQQYLVNPKVILPTIGYYCSVRDKWDRLKAGGKI